MAAPYKLQAFPVLALIVRAMSRIHSKIHRFSVREFELDLMDDLEPCSYWTIWTNRKVRDGGAKSLMMNG